MKSLDNARLILSRALGLMRADGQTAEAEDYLNAAEKELKEAIAEDPMNAQVHFTYAQLWEARQRYDEAGVRYRDALSLDPTDGTIQAAYEAMQAQRERDELAKRLGAVEAEASPTPPALEPVVEEEERVAEIAPEVEEAPLVEEVPVEIEELYRDAPGLDPTNGIIPVAYEAMQVERERDELAKMFEAVAAEASSTPPALEPVVEEEERVAEIAPEVEEAPLVEEVPAEKEEPYRDAPGLAPTDEPIQAAYEAVQVERERDELAKMFEAVEAEASLTPPAFEPIVEEEEFMTEIALEVEEALPVEEVPVEAEIPSPQDRYWALGIYRVEQGDLASAEEAFKRALDFAPRHEGALKAYSSLLLDQQRYTEAEEHLATFMEVDPSAVDTCLAGRDTSAPLLKLRGSLHARQGELEAAEPLLRKALELEPKRVEWIVTYAKLLDELNRRPEAIEWLRGALAQELDHVALHCEYIRLIAEQGQFDEVERYLRQAIDLHPDDPVLLALRDKLQPELEAYQNASGYMALAQIRAGEGSTHEAEALFEKALKIYSYHLPTLKAYAKFLEQQERFSYADRIRTMVAVKRPEETETILKEILNTRGESGETLNSLARICIELGRIDEAVEYLRRSLDIAPGSPETLHLLVDVLEGQGRRREAETLLGDNLVAVEADPKLSLQYAQLLAARGDYDQAKKFYQRARELAPDDPEVVRAWEEVAERIERFDRASEELAVGRVAAQSGNYAEAEMYYQQALVIDPEHVPTLRYYARLLFDTNRPMEAWPYLVRLARFDSEAAEEYYRNPPPGREDNSEVRCGYALFLQDLGRLAEARKQFQLALVMDPAYQPALNPYVDLLLQENEVCAAETALKLALKQDDAAAEIHWRYGNLLINKRHRYQLARPHLARAVELSDDLRFRESYDRIAGKLDQVQKAELAWALAKEMVETDPAKAESLFQDAYDACPDHVPTLMDYGEFLLKRGRPGEGLDFKREAARLDPCEENIAWLRAKPEEVSLEQFGFKEENSPGEEESAVRIQTELEAAPSEPTSPEDDEDRADSL